VEYVEAGCDGFVASLDYGRPGLDEPVLELGERVALSAAARRFSIGMTVRVSKAVLLP
jgi:hypothetical protein